ncbi:hypothetical protein [Streptomyces pseudogriseolus]|uniref:hypothetical protein n=2 Tax=Streptomyces pseudogriseolus TaxID=36817 RepID=UPI001CE31793|nr:hypothetical protein [Streptomyces pseudogriseolus]
MTRHIHARTLTAGMALLLAATLTSCGEKEPSAVEKDLAEKCGGRITAGSLGFSFDEGVKTKAIGSWHKSGNGQCLITANDKHDFWTAFHLQILRGDNAREVEALRRDRCADDRSDPTRYPGYADGEGFCSAYDPLNPGGGYRAVGAVDRYYVEIRLPGDRPNSHPDAAKKPRERFSKVMDDLREYYKG